VGAVRHGWGHLMPVGLESALWLASALAIPTASALLLSGTALACTAGGLRRALLLLAVLRPAGLAPWAATHRDYVALAVDSALGAALVLALLALAARRGEFDGLGPAAAGAAVGLGGALLRQVGIAPHPHFNENDLYHLVQVVSMWLLYRGGCRLRARAPAAATP